MDVYCWQLAWSCSPMLMRLGEYPGIAAALRVGLAAAERLSDLAARGQVHHDLGYACTRLGEFAEADLHLRRALEIFTVSGNWGVGLALWHCQRALELHLESGVRSGAADTLDSIGFAYAGLGDHEQAIVHYRQAVEMFQEIGDPRGEWQALIHLGDAHLVLGQGDEARRSWERALALVTVTPGGDSYPIRDRMARLA